MKLFESGKIGSLNLKNRIVMASMGCGGLIQADGKFVAHPSAESTGIGKSRPWRGRGFKTLLPGLAGARHRTSSAVPIANRHERRVLH